MNQYTKDLLDTYVSDKILTDRQNAAAAIEELRRDPRYQKLKADLSKTRFFEPDPYMYLVRVTTIHVVLSVSVVWLMASASWPVRVIGMALAGFSIIQGTFIAHEVDHGAVSKGKRLREVICQYLMTVLSGYGYSYFRRDHELHHFHCQEERLDPDTHSDLVSVYEGSALEKRGIGRVITRYQALIVPFLYLFWALDSKRESIVYMLRNPRKTRADQFCLVLHFALWFGLGGYYFGFAAAMVNYLGWALFSGLYLGVIIPVNHVGTVVIRPSQRLPFVEQQIITSRNIAGPRFMDFLFIAQNLQIEHHLFPFVPGTRLRCGREVVKRFCEEHGFPYREVSYTNGLREVWGHFRRMAALTRRPETQDEPCEVRTL